MHTQNTLLLNELPHKVIFFWDLNSCFTNNNKLMNSWMERPTHTHKQTVSCTLKRHTNKHSRPEWGETSVCKCVSHNCFFTSQQKLDIFHFLLWRVWEGGWARSRAVAMETMSFPVGSYLRLKQMLWATYGHMNSTLLQRRELLEPRWTVYRVTQRYRAELLQTFLFQFVQVYKVPLTASYYPSTGYVHAVNHIIGWLGSAR